VIDTKRIAYGEENESVLIKKAELTLQEQKKQGATKEMITEAVACAMFVAAGSQLSQSEVYEKNHGEKGVDQFEKGSDQDSMVDRISQRKNSLVPNCGKNVYEWRNRFRTGVTMMGAGMAITGIIIALGG